MQHAWLHKLQSSKSWCPGVKLALLNDCAATGTCRQQLTTSENTSPIAKDSLSVPFNTPMEVVNAITCTHSMIAPPSVAQRTCKCPSTLPRHNRISLDDSHLFERLCCWTFCELETVRQI